MATTSLREQILARFAAVLTGATPAGANVFRSREVAITRAVSPAVTVLYGGGKSTRRQAIGVDHHTITVRVGIFVRGDPWDTLADAIDTVAHPLLMRDATLQALGAQLLREGDEVEAQEADRTAGLLNVTYSVVYMTRADDITAAP